MLFIAFIVFLVRRSRNAQQRRTIDPVCSVKVSRKQVAGESTFRDVTYYFCSLDHKEAFDRDPVQYLLKT